ncbi:hypothetical protein Xentx_02854 [Xenorhabdus thuongxuanensis]|uniref:Uncharacterized protein n=1 Tax=Xenorhabdus thuongxuanensis TaxID=1873484 RepID=A0A1Q5TV48_9GAMM|nr:hypothetical protein Xentx_02854 [Xenorhabdus thuongxuanensis]
MVSAITFQNNLKKTLGDFSCANCNENVCAMLDKFYQNISLWINLFICWYKMVFCCVINQTIIIFKKNYCHIRKTPYNAPPLTDDVLRHAATAAEKNENNRLTPEANSVRYAASQPGSHFRLPMLFNKLIRQSVWALARHLSKPKGKQI